MAAKAFQHRPRVLGPTIRREGEPNGGLRRAVMGAIVDRMHPKPRRLRLAGAGVEHRHGRIVVWSFDDDKTVSLMRVTIGSSNAAP